jgi:hypothetical protein
MSHSAQCVKPGLEQWNNIYQNVEHQYVRKRDKVHEMHWREYVLNGKGILRYLELCPEKDP